MGSPVLAGICGDGNLGRGKPVVGDAAEDWARDGGGRNRRRCNIELLPEPAKEKEKIIRLL